MPRRRASYVLDLNDSRSNRSSNRISLAIGVDGRFAIEVTDNLGRSRAVSSATPISSSQLGRRWYHVVAVKSGTSSLALYVDGVLAASTDVAVPAQTNAPRVVRVGTRVSDGTGYFYEGAVHSIALWSTPLRSAEVSDLFRGGDWSRDLSRP